MHLTNSQHNTPGSWAKRCYFAGRAVMEAILRPYDLGPTQWYVLWQVANHGPTQQQELLRILLIEKPTLSEVIASLVRKGLIEQVPDPADQRQRVVKITVSGKKLWQKLPDPPAVINKIAFDGMKPEELATAVRVLQAATQRLNDHLKEGSKT